PAGPDVQLPRGVHAHPRAQRGPRVHPRRLHGAQRRGGGEHVQGQVGQPAGVAAELGGVQERQQPAEVHLRPQLPGQRPG
ncbi:unnamed protein product, partial [Heterosigma akashiwo]